MPNATSGGQANGFVLAKRLRKQVTTTTVLPQNVFKLQHTPVVLFCYGTSAMLILGMVVFRKYQILFPFETNNECYFNLCPFFLLPLLVSFAPVIEDLSSTSVICSDTINAEYCLKKIQSPNYPDAYENLASCTWTIKVPPGYEGSLIKISFEYFHTEPPIPTADFDWVEITETDRTPTVYQGSYADPLTPPTYVSKKPDLT